MKLRNTEAEIFVPDSKSVEDAMKRTTHMGIGAHPDDLEIMAYHGILQCFGNEEKWFFGVIVTNGSGSPRDSLYANYSDEEMQRMRRAEQKKAAIVGEYSAVTLLDYPSSAVKDPKNKFIKDEIKELVRSANPSFIYTHNLADKHDTHVAVALRTIHALRELPEDSKPEALYGCEVWRDLDWMVDADKVAFDVAAHENLSCALVSIFDSQVCGGKRYDLATIGRRRANATYHDTHGTDVTSSIIFAMDMTPLIKDTTMDIKEYTKRYIDRFAQDVLARIEKLM